jgi:hypothetical protein
MDSVEFEELKKRTAREKSILGLKSKILDIEFKLIEREISTKNLVEELERAKESLSNLENFED